MYDDAFNSIKMWKIDINVLKITGRGKSNVRCLTFLCLSGQRTETAITPHYQLLGGGTIIHVPGHWELS